MTFLDNTPIGADLRALLGLLKTERRITLTSLAAHDARYLEDVVDELKATQAAYVTRTVIELT